MTWKSRRFRLTQTHRLTHLGWEHLPPRMHRLMLCVCYWPRTANSSSAAVQKWPLQPFPAGIFPMVCIFSWTKQMDAMTFFFNTLRCWVWDFSFFDQIRAWKSFCAYGFGAEACQEQADCMSWAWCHTCHTIQHRIQLCTCTDEIFGLLSFIKPGHCELHQGMCRYSLITSRSLLPCFKFLFFAPPLFQ